MAFSKPKLILAIISVALIALSASPDAPRSAADDGSGGAGDAVVELGAIDVGDGVLDAAPDGVGAVFAAPTVAPAAGGKTPDGDVDDLSPDILGGAKEAQAFPNLAYSLDGVAAAAGGDAGSLITADAADDSPPSDEASAVDVSVYAASDISDAKSFLERHGVAIDYSGKTWLEASVPARLLGALSERAGVIRVETIVRAIPDQAPSPSPTPEPCREERGTLTVGGLASEEAMSGAWTTACQSATPPPDATSGSRNARFYTFTLSARADVRIDLVTPDGAQKVDPYLYLRAGQSVSGTSIASNDDRGETPKEVDSRIERAAATAWSRQSPDLARLPSVNAAEVQCEKAELGRGWDFGRIVRQRA